MMFLKARVIGWLAIVAFITVSCMAVYRAGYNAATVEVDRLVSEAERNARAAEQAFWEGAVERAEANIRTEEVIVERIKEVERKIPVVVDRIVEVKPDCAALPELAELFNDQIRASRDPGDPGDPAEPHD